MQHLLDLIEEEAEIIEPEDHHEEKLKEALYSAHRKISKDGPVTRLTLEEKLAVRYALQDAGELYLFAGTSAGFDSETTGNDVVTMQQHGRQARTEAAALGIYAAEV